VGALKKIYLIIDEAGDDKKRTDYVSLQYLGKIRKIDNRIVVAVTAWGLIDGITFL